MNSWNLIKIRELLDKPYDLLAYRRFDILHTYGIVIFNFIFLLFFQPFRLSNLDFYNRLKALLIYFIVILPVLLINLYLMKRVFKIKYTVGNTILWFAWTFFLVAVGLFIINAYLFNRGQFYFSLFFWFISIALTTSIIPLAIIVLYHYNFLLTKRLGKANEINEILKYKHVVGDKSFIITDENNNKKIMLSLDSLLYITSADNYIDVFYYQDGNVKHEMIRNSLSNIEKTYVDIKQLFRCHKSYIVNTTKVSSITGNSAGYKLKIQNTDKLIPVSRMHNRIVEIFDN
jgi:hypothetical protein